MGAKRKTGTTCLTLNLLLPGAGTLLTRRPIAASAQLLISAVALAMFVKGTAGGYQYFSKLLEGASPDAGYQMPLAWMAAAIILFKVSFIWAQFSTARHYREIRAQEDTHGT